ncbi:hypothetical protein PT974_08005 [Cladobotryum mycophilum]|uniref:Glyoxalase-like domain-containing protein n=1 Tax=Cladobotryum mycophilum TaxID=491253 RepID=A0ABR0SD76_9HYPO
MATQSAPQPTLDHIVILVFHSTLLVLPERLKDHFVVSPGGEHADGLTSNKLILFQDGVYIELIAFYDDADPEARKKHRLGNLKENTIIDWAYTLPHEEDFAAVQQRVRDASTGITYDDPVPGGRTKPDGTVLKWSIGAARDANGQGIRPGSLPFWCLDRTPRNLRVPYENNTEQTQHPCGARGVSRLRLSERKEEVNDVSKVYGAIHQVNDPDDAWNFHVPSNSTGARHTISVSGEDESGVKLALLGSEGSPSFIEILPGLVVKIES